MIIDKKEVMNRKLFINLNPAIIYDIDRVDDAYELLLYLDAILIDIELQPGYLEGLGYDHAYFDMIYRGLEKEVNESLE